MDRPKTEQVSENLHDTSNGYQNVPGLWAFQLWIRGEPRIEKHHINRNEWSNIAMKSQRPRIVACYAPNQLIDAILQACHGGVKYWLKRFTCYQEELQVDIWKGRRNEKDQKNQAKDDARQIERPNFCVCWCVQPAATRKLQVVSR